MEAVIARPPLPAGPFLVVGLARSGVAAALALRERGATVIGVDAGAVAPATRARLVAAGVAVHERERGVGLLDGIAMLVKSPGVPREAAVVAAALERGIAVAGELEVGWRLLGNDVVAVTGSNGKTTTVELLGHVHRVARRTVVVAGNVGTALTSLAGTLPGDAVVVLEASSFQLEDTLAFAPDAALLLNLTEDHLDRHRTLARYRAAKLEAFARQPAGALAVLPAAMAADADVGGAAERVTFGPGGDVDERDGALRWRGAPLIECARIRLPGAHNRENAMAAAAVALARGIEAEAVREALATFAGVPHRLEPIATVAGVAYVNDSKATNVASAEVAVRSYEHGVHLICGGRGKGSDYGPLVEPVARRASGAYLIGEAGPELAAALAPTGVPLHDCGDLERAVAAAHAAARSGDTVLLSPACASYDQYASYEERGEHFRALVAALAR